VARTDIYMYGEGVTRPSKKVLQETLAHLLLGKYKIEMISTEGCQVPEPYGGGRGGRGVIRDLIEERTKPALRYGYFLTAIAVWADQGGDLKRTLRRRTRGIGRGQNLRRHLGSITTMPPHEEGGKIKAFRKSKNNHSFSGRRCIVGKKMKGLL